MKRVLTLILLFTFSNCIAENTIIAKVNNDIVTLNSIKEQLSTAKTNAEKIIIINNRIDIVLQLAVVKELDITQTKKDIDKALIQLANINNISLKQLNSYPEISMLIKEIAEKLSILNLQRFITKDISVNFSKSDVKEACSSKDSDINLVYELF